MRCLPETASRAVSHWSVVGPAALVDALAPLANAWRQRAAVVHLHRLAQGERLTDLLDPLLGAQADLQSDLQSGAWHQRPLVLVLEDPSQPSLRATASRRWHAPGPGPLTGWLRMDAAALAAYAARAVSVLHRADETPAALVLLGPREARYLTVLDELQACAAGASGLQALRWSAERIRKPPLLEALRLGAAAALYTGHGNRHGWLAYGGLACGDFVARAQPCSPDETTALFFALGCGGANPDGIADTLVAQGVAGAVLAPIGDPLHADNRLLAIALVKAMAQGHRALPRLLDAVSPTMVEMHGAGYVVIGDPGLGAWGAPGSLARGLGVVAPAPDAVLGQESQLAVCRTNPQTQCSSP